jgi:methylated-DNA-[protein]-cysteine S-methyltransferase
LPEVDVAATRARMARRHPQAAESEPPAAVLSVIERVRGLPAGERDDLADVAIDLDGLPAFHRRVYEIARAIPPGATLTYGELAARLGEPGAARAVGHALGRNPFPIVVPCHRVLAADGRMHGFSAHGGTTTKRRLLLIEGAALRDPPGLFDGMDAFGRPTGQPPSSTSSDRGESSADPFSSARDEAQGSGRKDIWQTRPAGA